MIRGLSPEPEVDQVKEALRATGVAILDTEPCTCVVDGADGRLSGRLSRTVPPDRMEAATYIFLAVAKRTPLRLNRVRPGDLPHGLHRVLGAMSVDVSPTPDQDGLVAVSSALRSVDLETAPHPGFPTDAQPQLSALLAFADGVSTIRESIYPRRTTHVEELNKLNIVIEVAGPRQTIPGHQRASRGTAEVRDIRCGAALLVAAATVPGRTVLRDASRHLWRGYSDLGRKLGALGISAAWAT